MQLYLFLNQLYYLRLLLMLLLAQCTLNLCLDLLCSDCPLCLQLTDSRLLLPIQCTLYLVLCLLRYGCPQLTELLLKFCHSLSQPTQLAVCWLVLWVNRQV